MGFNVSKPLTRDRDVWCEHFTTEPKTQRLKRSGWKTRTLEAKHDTDTRSPELFGYYTKARERGSKSIACELHGATLRVEDAGEAYRGTLGYYCDEYAEGTYVPVVAKLARSRGWIVGYRMESTGECVRLAYGHSYADRNDARLAAHNYTEREAEKEREYQAEESERIAAEEREAEAEERKAEALRDTHAEAVAGFALAIVGTLYPHTLATTTEPA